MREMPTSLMNGAECAEAARDTRILMGDIAGGDDAAQAIPYAASF